MPMRRCSFPFTCPVGLHAVLCGASLAVGWSFNLLPTKCMLLTKPLLATWMIASMRARQLSTLIRRSNHGPPFSKMLWTGLWRSSTLKTRFSSRLPLCQRVTVAGVCTAVRKSGRSLLLRSELGTATLIRPKKPSQSKPAPAPSRSSGCALFESHMCILGGVTSWLRNGMPFAVPVGMGRVSRSGCCHLSILKLSTRLGLCLSLPFRRRTGYRMSSMSSSMTVVRLHAKRPSSDRTCSGLRIGWMMS